MKIRDTAKSTEILKYLALGAGIMTISIFSPLAGDELIKIGIRSYIKKNQFDRYKFLRDIKKLQERDLIDFKELDNGEVEIKLTKLGRLASLKYKIDEIKLQKPEKWDKKWRLIIFDIPHSYKSGRDAFRRKLDSLGFYSLQKSVFISPYPCEDEIDFIASFFDIRKYVLILYISHFEGDIKLKNYFGV